VNAPIFILAVLLSAASLAEGGTVTGTVIAFRRDAAKTVVYLSDAPPPKAHAAIACSRREDVPCRTCSRSPCAIRWTFLKTTAWLTRLLVEGDHRARHRATLRQRRGREQHCKDEDWRVHGPSLESERG